MPNNVPAMVQHCNQAVLTTNLIAQAYETTDKIVWQNFDRNRDHFVLGKHYFLLEGEMLNEFKICNPQIEGLSKNARSLLLWTKKGAFLVAKSINTDVAWNVYEELVDFYFEAREVTERTTKEQLQNELAMLQFVQTAVDQISQSISQRWIVEDAERVFYGKSAMDHLRLEVGRANRGYTEVAKYFHGKNVFDGFDARGRLAKMQMDIRNGRVVETQMRIPFSNDQHPR